MAGSSQGTALESLLIMTLGAAQMFTRLAVAFLQTFFSHLQGT
jgi:hypothetical protein